LFIRSPPPQVSYVNHVTPIPEGFDSNAAASILCAVRMIYFIYLMKLILNKGVTVYRAIKYSQTSPGDWIVLPGAGGGLGHLGAFAPCIAVTSL
jgi:propanol-preferring alcohol dehydrogenase